MEEKDDSNQRFSVTIEDCKRWTERLQRMAKTLEKRQDEKDSEEYADGIKLFYTASVLMQRLQYEIQQDAMFSSVPQPFGPVTVGES